MSQIKAASRAFTVREISRRLSGYDETIAHLPAFFEPALRSHFMERIDSINPERIAWCCEDLGITPEELAAATSVPLSDLSSVLARAPAAGLMFDQLRNISAYLCQDVLFFVEPGPVDAAQAHSEAFRSLLRQQPRLVPALKRLIEQAERQRTVFMALQDQFDSGDLAHFQQPALPENGNAHIAHAVRQWLALGAANAFHSYRTAVEQQGILVFVCDENAGAWQYAGDSPILAFALYDEQVPLIAIKRQYPESEQSLVLMHALAHLLAHRHTAIIDASDLHSHYGDQGDANAIARQILIPDTYLAEISDQRQPDDIGEFDDWLQTQRKKWGASADVFLWRLVGPKRLPKGKYAEYVVWRHELIVVQGSRTIRHPHLHDLQQKYGDLFVKTVLDALDRRYITLPKASSYLEGLKLDDLHALERSYADY